MKKLIILPILLMLSLNHAIAQKMYKQFTDQQLIQILKEEGYTASIREKNFIVIKIDGQSYGFYNNSNDRKRLKLFYGIGDVTMTYKDANNWNTGYVHATATVDSDKNPALVSYLNTEASVTKENVLAFFKRFVSLVRYFRDYVRETSL